MTNLAGLTFPGLPGQHIDHLQAAWVLRCAQVARDLLDAAEDPVSQTMIAALDALPEAGALSVFNHPLAAFDTGLARELDLPDNRSPAERRVALVRHLIGAPGMPGFTLVLTGDALSTDLFLPHLGIVLKTPGDHVLGIHQSGNTVKLIRDDGQCATFQPGIKAPAHLQHPLFHSALRVAGFDVLNADPAVMHAVDPLGPSTGHALSAAVARMGAGIEMLTQFWPEAHDALARHVKGLVLLETRDYQRSHSPKSLCGAIIMTAGTPLSIGDILCHEASHIRMHWAKEVDPLFEDRRPGTDGYDSPWRPDKRPLDGLMLGVHAFLNVCAWYARAAQKSHGDLADISRRLHDKQAANVRTAWALLQKEGKPTVLGQSLVREWDAAVARLQDLTPEPADG